MSERAYFATIATMICVVAAWVLYNNYNGEIDAVRQIVMAIVVGVLATSPVTILLTLFVFFRA